MNLFKSFYLIAVFTIITSCWKSKNGSANPDDATDSLTYVVFKDAAEIDKSWSKENTVIVHTIAEPDNLHPTNGTSSIRSELFLYTQMSLVQTDLRSPGLRPGLCRELPRVSADGLTYTYELKEEVRWDDGSPLSISDIVFTAKANKCPLVQNPSTKPYWENLKDIVVDASNPRKFSVVMAQPYIQNIAFWSDFPVMQQKFFDPANILAMFSFDQFTHKAEEIAANADLQKWAAGFNDQKFGFDVAFLNGVGMYKVEKWEPGQFISLVKKKNHWTQNSDRYFEKALPEKIIYKVNRDGNSQLLEFKAQTYDASGYVSAKTLMELQADQNFNRHYNSKFMDTYGYTYIAMNMKPDGLKRKKIFDDVNVRAAMAMITPVDEIIKTVNKSVNKRISGPVSILKKEYANLPLINVDYDRAAKLLAEAGWKDSDGDNIREKLIDGKKTNLEFDFNYLTTQVEWSDMAAIVAESFLKVGVKANLVPMDPQAFTTKAREHDFDMMMGSWGTNSLPEDFTQLWHSSSWTTNGSNYSGFGNTESDSLIDKIKATLDASQREPMIRELQQIIYKEQPYVFLYALVRRNILHKRWGNAEMYYDRPGLLYSNLKLLSGTVKDEVTAN